MSKYPDEIKEVHDLFYDFEIKVDAIIGQLQSEQEKFGKSLLKIMRSIGAIALAEEAQGDTVPKEEEPVILGKPLEIDFSPKEKELSGPDVPELDIF